MNCRFAYRFDHLAPRVATAEKFRRRRSRFRLFDYDSVLAPHRLGRCIVARRLDGDLVLSIRTGHEAVSVACQLDNDVDQSPLATVAKWTKGLDRLVIGHELSPSGDVGLRYVRWVEQQHTLRESGLASWHFMTTERDVWHAVADEAERRWHQRWQRGPR